MALTAGTRLGSYEVTAQIGAGGMGEVYQAHDTKLGRDVAIKVLPEAFAHDPERLSRFQREAKMLAAARIIPTSLRSTAWNIPTARSYLVMELVSGETLAERVKRDGAVPIEEALADCEADRRSSRSRARKRHHSPRLETCKREADARRKSQGSWISVWRKRSLATQRRKTWATHRH